MKIDFNSIQNKSDTFFFVMLSAICIILEIGTEQKGLLYRASLNEVYLANTASCADLDLLCMGIGNVIWIKCKKTFSNKRFDGLSEFIAALVSSILLFRWRNNESQWNCRNGLRLPLPLPLRLFLSSSHERRKNNEKKTKIIHEVSSHNRNNTSKHFFHYVPFSFIFFLLFFHSNEYLHGVFVLFDSLLTS